MMKTLRNLAGAAFALAMVLWGNAALAQAAGSAVSPRCVATASAPSYAEGAFAPCSQDRSGNQRITGSISASLAGFTPNGNYATPLSVSNVSANVALPAGAVVLVTNPGATVAYVNLGTSNAVTATTSHIPVPAGGGCAFTVGSNTYLAAITASSTTTLNLGGGAGLGNTCFGGGSGGGGGVVTNAGTFAVQNTAATPAGTNLIGKAGIDQTTPGTTNGVVVNSSALPTGASTAANQATGNTSLATIATNTTNAGTPTIAAGANLIGKVGIDQTTPGTTNGVQATNAGTFATQIQATNGDALTDTGNALNVNIASGASVAQGSTTSGQTGALVQGATTTSAPSYTTGKTNPLSLATDGSLRTIAEGAAASGASVVGNPLGNGCRAATAAPTAVTDGQAVFNECGAEGKQINLPYSIKELMLRGAASGTSGAIALTGMGAQGASVKIYITGAQCFRTDAGTTLAYVTLNDVASTTIPLPVGSGSNEVFSVPLVFAANTGVTFTPSATLSTVFCNAQGYAGP